LIFLSMAWGAWHLPKSTWVPLARQNATTQVATRPAATISSRDGRGVFRAHRRGNFVHASSTDTVAAQLFPRHDRSASLAFRGSGFARCGRATGKIACVLPPLICIGPCPLAAELGVKALRSAMARENRRAALAELFSLCAGVHVDFHANLHFNDLRCFPGHSSTPMSS
jgi:hypothetical protein